VTIFNVMAAEDRKFLADKLCYMYD